MNQIGTHFSLCNSGKEDLLSKGAFRPRLWAILDEKMNMDDISNQNLVDTLFKLGL